MAETPENSVLFVYGSLKRGGKLHHELITADARFLGSAKIQAELFQIQGESWPGAFPPTHESYIYGELYQLSHPAPTLARLDQVEGCNEGLYTRKLANAWTGSGELEVWVYFCNLEKRKGARIVSGVFPESQSTKVSSL